MGRLPSPIVVRRLEAVVRERDFEMPPTNPGVEPTVSALLRELDALRARLDQAQEWFNRPQDTMKAGALAQEVRRLCYEASSRDGDTEVATLIDRARSCLDELQVLLGSH
jgi:hypothetical protein